MIVCIQKYKNAKTNKVIAYDLKDQYGGIYSFCADELKREMMFGEIVVNNLKLTSDGKLIEVKGGAPVKCKKLDGAEAYAIENKDWLMTMFEGSIFTYEKQPGNMFSVGDIGQIDGKSLAFSLLKGPKAEYIQSRARSLAEFVYSRPLSIMCIGDKNTNTVKLVLGSYGEIIPQLSRTFTVDPVRGFSSVYNLQGIVNDLCMEHQREDSAFRKNMSYSYIEGIEAEKKRRKH